MSEIPEGGLGLDDGVVQVAEKEKTDLPNTRASLKLYHALGYAQPPEGGKVIEHISENSIAYLVGKHVAVFTYSNQKTLSHKFILKNSKVQRIVAFAVSANRRYIALSEVLHPEGSGIQVSIYNFNTASKVRELGRSRFPNAGDGPQPPVISLDFSRDNKYLVTVTDFPSPYIYLWQLDKQRLVGMSEVHQKIAKVTISPWSHWVMCTTGTSILRLWRAQGNQLKSFDPLATAAQTKDYRFTCHAWYDDDRLLAGTAEGDILVIEGQELRRVIPEIHGPGNGISCICCVGRGFVACGDNGIISTFERTYDSQHFSCFKKCTTPPHIIGSSQTVKVMDISINPTEDGAVCCFSNNEMAFFNLTQLDEDDTETTRGSHSTVFTRLPIGFHDDAVTGVDVCLQRSILVTASADKHVRVWNFMKKRVEIDKYMQEEVLSVAIHPSGNLLLVGLRYKLCMYAVLVNDLHLCHEFPSIKQCKEVRFSHGGQLFAAVGNPWSRIVVYNAYTFQPLGVKENVNGVPLTGHSASVQSICWSRNDQNLVSAGSEGAVYEWRVYTAKRNEANETVCKNVNYSCVRYDDDTQMVAALGVHKSGLGEGRGAESSLLENEVTLRTFRFASQNPPKMPQRTLSTPIAIPPKPSTSDTRTHRTPRTWRACQVAISSLAQTVFVGTSDGRILLFTWPPTDADGTPEPYSTLEVHQGEIQSITLSIDERFLFSVGAEDNCLFMFDVDVISEGRPVGRKAFPYSALEGVAYVLHQELDDRSRRIAELSSINADHRRRQQAHKAALQDEHQRIMQSEELEMSSRLREMNEAMEASLKEAALAKEKAAAREAAITDIRLKTAEGLEALYSKRTEDLLSRQKALEDEKDDLAVRYENKLHKMEAEWQAERRQMEINIKEVEQKLVHTIEQLQKEKQVTLKDMNGMIDTMIMDYLAEVDGEPGIEGVHEKWSKILAEKEEQCARTKTATALFKTKREKHQKEIELLEAHIEELREQELVLQQRAQEHAKANDTLKGEIAQRNETISTAERTILELKKQTAELEKLRYVLTYKFNELRKEVAPKEEQIKTMNDKIQEMDSALEKVGIERDCLQEKFARKDELAQTLMKTLQKHNRTLDDKLRQMQQLLRHSTDIVTTTDPNVLRERLKALIRDHEKYTRGDATLDLSSEKHQEFERQRQYMTAQLGTLGTTSKSTERRLRTENQLKTEENVQLVKEINAMRAERRHLLARCQQADSQLKEARAVVQRQQNEEELARKMLRPMSAPATTSTRHTAPSPAGVLPQQPPARNLKGIRGRGPVKGQIIKGSTRSLRDLSDMDPVKIAQIVQQVERTNSEIAAQAEELNRLRDFVQHLLQRAENEQPAKTEEERKRRATILEAVRKPSTATPVGSVVRPKSAAL